MPLDANRSRLPLRRLRSATRRQRRTRVALQPKENNVIEKMLFQCQLSQLKLELLSEELDSSDARAAVQSGYEQFLDLNPSMLQLCTDWQVVNDASGEQKLNDHSDSAYDDEILGRLGDLDRQVTRILGDLIEALSRFSNYPFRFGIALDKVLAGELDWLTKPIMPSYHTVWFELHEDLLATLGIDRASESTS